MCVCVCVCLCAYIHVGSYVCTRFVHMHVLGLAFFVHTQLRVVGRMSVHTYVSVSSEWEKEHSFVSCYTHTTGCTVIGA